MNNSLNFNEGSSNSNLSTPNQAKPKSNDSILNRVTSKVTGLLSPWSEWLSTRKEEEDFVPLANFCQPSTSKGLHPFKSFSPILNSSTSQGFKTDIDRSSHFLPSTSAVSEPQNGSLALPSEDNLELLKKSLCDTNIKSPFAKLNGSLTTPTGIKKRSRDSEQQDSREESSTFLHSLTRSDAPSSKKPRFSVSSYGSPYTMANRTEVSEDQSPFYPSRVAFGGALNFHKARVRSATKKMTPRSQLTPSANKRLQEDADGGLSSAAKRILSCIDRISTPLSNSKRIPLPSSRRDLDTSTYVADFHKHRPALKAHSPPTNKLLTPSKAKVNSLVPSLLKSSAKDSLSGSSNSVRRQERPNSSPYARPSIKDSPLTTFKAPIKAPAAAVATLLEQKKSSPAPTPMFSFNSLELKKSSSVDPKEKESEQQLSFFKGPISTTSFLPSIESSKYVSSSISKKELPPHYTMSLETQPPLKTFSAAPPLQEKMQFVFSPPEILVSDPSGVKFSGLARKFSFKEPINEDKKTVSNNSFGNMFVVEKGSWECSCCLVQNKATVDSCVACLAPKMPLKTKTPSPPMSSAPLIASNWDKKLFPSTDNWECDVCLVPNKMSLEKCVACETSRPGKKSTLEESSSSALPVASWTGSFKMPTDVWECVACLVSNSNSVDMCVACQTSKPNQWGDQFKPKEGAWDCDVCMVQNTSQSTSCVACQTPKPGQNKTKPLSTFGSDTTAKSTSSTVASSFKFGLQTGSDWDCETCLVNNKSTATKCLCCETPKDKTSANLVSEALTGNFKFGAQTSKSSFSFGVKNTPTTISSSSPSSTTTDSAAKPAFSFGLNSSSNEISSEKSFSFAPKVVSKDSSKNEFSFGVPAPVKEPEAKAPLPPTLTAIAEVPKVAPVPTFSFGSAIPQKKSADAPAPGATSNKSPATSLFTFGSTENEQKKEMPAPTASGLYTFKDSSKTDTAPAPTSVASNPISFTPKETKEPPAPSSLFSFGATDKEKAAPPPALFNFGAQKPPVATGAAPAFSFVEKKEPESQKPSSLFTFGSAAVPKPAEPSKGFDFKTTADPAAPPLFGFGSKTNGVTPAPTSKPSSGGFTFGPPPGQSAPTFGNPEKKDSLFSFGASAAKDAPPQSAPGFGFGSAITSTPVVPSFGAGAAAAAPKPAMEFGGFGSEPQKAATTGFSFGSGQNMTGSSFAFGASNNNSAPAFNFGQQQMAPRTGSPPVAPTYQQSPASVSNPFNILAAGAPTGGGGPERRRIKKAVRRHK